MVDLVSLYLNTEIDPTTLQNHLIAQYADQKYKHHTNEWVHLSYCMPYYLVNIQYDKPAWGRSVGTLHMTLKGWQKKTTWKDLKHWPHSWILARDIDYNGQNWCTILQYMMPNNAIQENSTINGHYRNHQPLLQITRILPLSPQLWFIAALEKLI